MDIYGGVQIPAQIALPSGTFPGENAIADPLLGYVGHFLYTIMTTYVGAAWASIQPGKPIVRTIQTGDPEEGFNEAWLPALFVYRSPRETRELVETFELVADDYRFEKSRTTVRWILDPMPQEHRRKVNNIVLAVRKAIDRSVLIGRDPAWKVPGDPDPKALVHGSSLANYAGFAVLELLHAAPGNYINKMAAPAPLRTYSELHMSLYVEELLRRDINLNTDPHETLKATYESPDQETGLGPFVLGEQIYE